MAGLEIIGALASVVSGVVGAMGAMQQAEAQARAAEAQARANDYNVKIQERNALIADQNRKTAIESADTAATDKRRDNRRVMAQMRAAYGTSGIEMAGSPLDVLEDTALEQELGAQRVKYEGVIRAREGAISMLGMQEDAQLQRMEASSRREEASGARAAGGIAAFGSLVGGVGNALTRVR